MARAANQAKAEWWAPGGRQKFGRLNGIQGWLATKLSLYVQQRKDGRE